MILDQNTTSLYQPFHIQLAGMYGWTETSKDAGAQASVDFENHRIVLGIVNDINMNSCNPILGGM
jgi:hypothetical protein